MTDPVADLLAVADELYGLGLTEFTATRDARATQHRGSELADRIKALRKPTTAAWVVDLLVRRDPDDLDQLLSVGVALREAQQAMSAAELRELTKQRRQVTAALTRQARRRAAHEGLTVTAGVAEQVEATLTAAMVDPECGRAVRSGLLVKPLATTGVAAVPEEELAAAVALPEALGHRATARSEAEPGRPDLRVVPDPDAGEKKRALAEQRLAEASETQAAANTAYEDATSDVDRLAARELQLQAEVDELRRRIAGLEEELEEVDDELADAQQVRAEAAAALRTATAERDAAATIVDRLG